MITETTAATLTQTSCGGLLGAFLIGGCIKITIDQIENDKARQIVKILSAAVFAGFLAMSACSLPGQMSSNSEIGTTAYSLMGGMSLGYLGLAAFDFAKLYRNRS